MKVFMSSVGVTMYLAGWYFSMRALIKATSSLKEKKPYCLSFLYWIECSIMMSGITVVWENFEMDLRWIQFYLYVMAALVIVFRLVVVSICFKIYVLVICSYYVAYILCAF